MIKLKAFSRYFGLLVVAILVGGSQLEAGTLTYLYSIDISTIDDGLVGEGIAFLGGNLYLVDNNEEVFVLTSNGSTPIPGVINPVGDLYTDSVFSVATVDSSAPDFRGIEALPNGNLLVLDENTDRIMEIDTTGALVSGGINFFTSGAASPAPGDFGPTGDLNTRGRSMALLGDSIFAASVDHGAADVKDGIYEYGTDGTFLNAFSMRDVLGVADASSEGLSIDPLTGNLMILEDITDVMVEVSTTGDLIASYDLLAGTGLTGDPEGLAFDAAGGRMFVSNDEGTRRIDVYDFTGTPAPVPEPTTMALLILGMFGLAVGRRKRA